MNKPEENQLARKIGKELESSDLRLVTVETTAGGLISAQLLSIAGASRWFDRGIVAYSERSKIDTFGGVGIDRELLRKYGAVSPEVVEMLVSSFCKYSGADFGIAESGLAGPKTSQRSNKTIGSVVIAVKSPSGVESESNHFEGNRIEIMSQVANCALEMLYESIVKYKSKSV